MNIINAGLLIEEWDFPPLLASYIVSKNNCFNEAEEDYLIGIEYAYKLGDKGRAHDLIYFMCWDFLIIPALREEKAQLLEERAKIDRLLSSRKFWPINKDDPPTEIDEAKRLIASLKSQNRNLRRSAKRRP